MCLFSTLIYAARLARADLPLEDATPPESAGLLAIFDGIRDGSASDEERLERGSVVCDALYAYCRSADAAQTDG